MSVTNIQLVGAIAEALAKKHGRPTDAAAPAPLTYAERAEKRVHAFLKSFKFREGGADRYNPAPGSSLCIPVDFRGRTVYISAPMVAGNSKLDPSVLIFDLMAVISCGNCKDCAGPCYAMKAQRQYADVYNKRALNLWLAVHAPDYLESLIREQLRKSKKRYVRLHSAGDFFSQSYLDMWARIAADFPRKKFYFYTKMDCAGSGLDFSAFLALRNVNRVLSVLPDGRINFGSWDYVQTLVKEGYKLCPYGVREYKARVRAEARADRRGLKGKARKEYIGQAVAKAKKPVHCGEGCSLCMRYERVCFLEH